MKVRIIVEVADDRLARVLGIDPLHALFGEADAAPKVKQFLAKWMESHIDATWVKHVDTWDVSDDSDELVEP